MSVHPRFLRRSTVSSLVSHLYLRDHLWGRQKESHFQLRSPAHSWIDLRSSLGGMKVTSRRGQLWFVFLPAVRMKVHLSQLSEFTTLTYLSHLTILSPYTRQAWGPSPSLVSRKPAGEGWKDRNRGVNRRSTAVRP